MPDVLFAATEGGEGKDAEITLPKNTNETGDMHVGGFSSNAAPAPVVEYIAPSVSYVTPAPVDYFTTAPTVDAAPALVVEFFSFAPVTHEAPAPVVEHVAPAPALVGEYMAPAPAPAPVVEYIAPAPTGYAAPAPVVAYTAPAPVAQHLLLCRRSRGCSCHVALHG